MPDKQVAPPQQQPEQQPVTHWVESPDGICDTYANMVHLTWSLDDVRVRFAQLVASPDARDPGGTFEGVAEERSAVTLAWRIAKILRDQLTIVIDRYEEANGPIELNIKLPPGGGD